MLHLHLFDAESRLFTLSREVGTGRVQLYTAAEVDGKKRAAAPLTILKQGTLGPRLRVLDADDNEPYSVDGGGTEHYRLRCAGRLVAKLGQTADRPMPFWRCQYVGGADACTVMGLAMCVVWLAESNSQAEPTRDGRGSSNLPYAVATGMDWC
eukprot:TRINITY_DN8985_c0_g1_i1.p2 TRINITY_DN8985_c0_g1~~TRINITY_DN8985_c0_g1_i1.p2  ORF type:complete len:153 (+),score=59.49 TRINITY_DN8985_c0_g1_i1:245-703(+)